MKRIVTFCLVSLLAIVFVSAQTIVHMHRHVPQENEEAYIEKEVKYWSKFAEEQLKEGKITFWAILKRVGGENLQSEPNFLIINNIKDIDADIPWQKAHEMFPGLTFNDISVDDLSTLTDVIFLHGLGNHIQGENAVPERDFNFVQMNYHNMKNLGKHLTFEEDQVKPYFKAAMDANTTLQTGWGNSIITSPSSKNFPYKSASYDLFASLGDALSPNRFKDSPFPDGFFDEWQENYKYGEVRIYRIIKVVNMDTIENAE